MQAKNYPINKWAKDDQPREKLLRKSPLSLSDAELLAILINNGIKGKSAVDLGREIMKLFNYNLNALFKMNAKELLELPGIGKAKAVTIMAALELGRRRHAIEIKESPVLNTSRSAAVYLRTLLRDSPVEIFGILYLNTGNRIIHFDTISQGGVSSTVVEPRQIMKKALQEDAAHLILCHNHPSGNTQPSAADKLLTKRIQNAANLLEISIVDHIIVSEEGYFSFADEGIL